MQARFNIGEYLTHDGTRLNFFVKALFDEDVPSILSFLERHPAVTSLNLENQKLLSKAAINMLLGCPALREINLSYLTSRHLLPEDLAEIVGQILQRNTRLRVLHLAQNDLTDEVLSRVFRGLDGNNHLTHLYLGYNNIRLATDAVLFETLRRNSCLQVLHLNNNQINCGGAERFARAYAGNISLREINLDKNDIADAGVIQLADQLLRGRLGAPQPLAFLSLQCNQFSDRGVKQLNQALHACPSLARIDISNAYFKEILHKQVQHQAVAEVLPQHGGGNDNNAVVMNDNASPYHIPPFYMADESDDAVTPTAPSLEWFDDETVVVEVSNLQAREANQRMYEAVPRGASPVVPVHNHFANLWNASESDEEYYDDVVDQEGQGYFRIQF